MGYGGGAPQGPLGPLLARFANDSHYHSQIVY